MTVTIMRSVSRFACIAVALAAVAALNDWSKPFPAHRVIANVYYVGTVELASFLITTPAGHVLVNTGLADSAPRIASNIRQLGFRVQDVKLLLTTQAHFDHVAGMAEIKRLTGARLAATSGDAPLLEDGGRTDFHFGDRYRFAPVKVDRILKDGETVELGGTRIVVHLTPGHTKGSVTYTLRVVEAGRPYDVVIANMGSINPGVKLLNNPRYPQIADDYARTFAVQKSLHCDVFLAAHASQYDLAKKYRAEYDPAAFVDPDGYRKAVADYERAYLEQLARERRAARIQ